MDRYLKIAIGELALGRNKMAFISGPRQVGKTTLSRSFKSDYDQISYRNWDDIDFRRTWTKSPNELAAGFRVERSSEAKLLILDEIHKSKGWKQKVKGLYDLYQDDFKMIVTGSARLNVFKRGGDSLLGRYVNFRLHPFSYGELIRENRNRTKTTQVAAPEDWKEGLTRRSSKSFLSSEFNQLYEFSGFPEPYLAASKRVHNIWRRSRYEKIIREDLRDLSRLPELSQVEMLASLLPSKVGSPLSVQSLREDIEVAHDTVSRWLRYLNELYFFFELKPWTKSIPRTLKKEGKIYLFDWTDVVSEGARFENFIASHLLKACQFWTDTGEGHYELFYLRNKEKEEIDFLITLDKKPWLCVEAKLSDTSIQKKVADKFTRALKCPFVQVVKESGVWRHADDLLLVSADRFLSGLP